MLNALHEALWTRRLMLGSAAAALATVAARAQPSTRRTRLILLGTKGGPTPSRARAPAANLLIVDGEPIVIDCPDGIARQLVLAGVDLATLRNLFVTHLHSDHAAGLAALLLLAWGSGLETPVTVYGPAGLANMVRLGLAAHAADIAYRIREEGRPDLSKLVRAREVRPGSISASKAVRVRCARVDHYTVPALAYRFDTPDRSFVFSGDTAPSKSLVDLARGADVLVHEAMLLPAIGRIVDANAPSLRDHLLKSHTTTEQIGQIAAAAGVRTLVLSHLVPAFADITDEQWTEGVRRYFRGEIIVGRDMMEL